MKRTPIDKIVAQKYAKAFMEVFPKSFTLNDVKKIEAAQKFLQTHKRTLFFLQLPQFTTERKKSMVADLIDYFSLPHDFAALILLLIHHDRSYYIPDVLLCVTELYKEQINGVEFSIQSPQALSESKIDSIKQFLGRLLNKKIIGIPSIDTSLIAGLRLQSNDYLWEYSIAKQMRALQLLKR